MNAPLSLIQGSPEWHAHRAQFRNASETAAVMGLSPWLTPYELWLLRTRRKEQAVTPAMARGTNMEPAARAAYELLTGQILEPLVLTAGEYSASLDGLTLDGELILEVKCPFKGRESDLWKLAANGEVPEYYACQIQHQLMVSGAKLAHLWVFDGVAKGLLVEVTPRPETWTDIKAAWDNFCEYLAADEPPPLSDKDCRIREDEAWQSAARSYLEAKAQLEVRATALEEAKAALLALASHSSESGAGVKVTKFWKAGSVDYKRVPALAGVDLEQYRGTSREEVRVTVR